MYRFWKDFFSSVSDTGIQVAGNDDAERQLRYLLGWHNLGLLELFGLVSVQHGPPEPGKGWCIEGIRRTPLGDALLALLYTAFFGDLDKLLELEAEEDVPPGTWICPSRHWPSMKSTASPQSSTPTEMARNDLTCHSPQ